MLQPNLTPEFLPVGTQVVLRIQGGDHHAGAVGVVTQSPTDASHAYRVRFTGGAEASFNRRQIAVLSTFHAESNVLADRQLFAHVIYRCVLGSRAYGLDDDASDTDRRGIYLPPADLQWSLFGVPEQLEDSATEEVYWELQKFLTLALKANPNILECLYTPLVEHADPIAQRLLEMRSVFLSKLVYQTYNGYVLSQFKKSQADLRLRGTAKPKHLMHLIRLLLAGIGTLRDGVVPVHVGIHRDKLMAIKRGEMSFDAVEVWRQTLHKQFDIELEKTSLPDRPDYAKANAFLIDARREMTR